MAGGGKGTGPSGGRAFARHPPPMTRHPIGGDDALVLVPGVCRLFGDLPGRSRVPRLADEARRWLKTLVRGPWSMVRGPLLRGPSIDPHPMTHATANDGRLTTDYGQHEMAEGPRGLPVRDGGIGPPRAGSSSRAGCGPSRPGRCEPGDPRLVLSFAEDRPDGRRPGDRLRRPGRASRRAVAEHDRRHLASARVVPAQALRRLPAASRADLAAALGDPVPPHCECEQLEIPPGAQAPIEFRDAGGLAEAMPVGGQVELVGALNWLIRFDGPGLVVGSLRRGRGSPRLQPGGQAQGPEVRPARGRRCRRGRGALRPSAWGRWGSDSRPSRFRAGGK